MSLIRIANPSVIRPGHVAMIVLFALTVGGDFLFYSGQPSEYVPDGAKEWPVGSLFRPLVDICNLDYAHPTAAGSDIKNLIFGMGVAAAMMSLALRMVLRPRGADDGDDSDTVIADPSAPEPIERPVARRQIPPLLAAQMLMLLYVGWSFASIAWSGATDVAMFGSFELAIFVLWAFALAYGLNRPSSRFAAYALVAAGALAAIIAYGYHIERRPDERAGFPIGNATTLGACLIPCILVAVCVLIGQVRDFGNPRRVRRILVGLGCAGALFLMWRAFHAASPRGAMAGLATGALGVCFFALRRRGKLAVAGIGVVAVLAAGWMWLPKITDFSTHGRDASFRARYHAWSYGLDLIAESKLLGHGQGGYVRKADALARGADALNDPEALSARIAHAHNEWLEVWTDLGSIGAVLLVGSLLLTLAGGAVAVVHLPSVTLRWVMIALLASLAALVVEESAGVGLRLAGLPPVFYGVIGLIWACGAADYPATLRVLQRSGAVRFLGGLVTVALAGGVGYLSIQDFRGARARYEVAGAIEQLEWDHAAKLAQHARDHRLSPQRRLTAATELSANLLHIARTHQVNGERRAKNAGRSDPPDPRLLDMASSDIAAAQNYFHRGYEALQDLVRMAPNFYNSHWIECEYQLLRARFFKITGDIESARKFEREAGVSLQREIVRRPFDTAMAERYALIAGPEIALDELWITLARPLRYSLVPATYPDAIAQLAARTDFEEKFPLLLGQAWATVPDNDPSAWSDPFAPEVLHLAAMVWTARGDGTLAAEALTKATALYAAVRPQFALGAAACSAELAQRLFINGPLDPTLALQTAAQAIKHSPPSWQGRNLVRMIRSRMVEMHIAAGDEPAARAALLDVWPDASALEIKLAIGTAYADLASRLPIEDWDNRRRLTKRSLELDETLGRSWIELARHGFNDNDDAECVRCLRESRRHGMPDDVIFRFVDAAVRQRPTSHPLREYSAELGAEIARQSQADAPSPNRPDPGSP